MDSDKRFAERVVRSHVVGMAVCVSLVARSSSLLSDDAVLKLLALALQVPFATKTLPTRKNISEISINYCYPIWNFSN